MLLRQSSPPLGRQQKGIKGSCNLCRIGYLCPCTWRFSPSWRWLLSKWRIGAVALKNLRCSLGIYHRKSQKRLGSNSNLSKPQFQWSKSRTSRRNLVSYFYLPEFYIIFKWRNFYNYLKMLKLSFIKILKILKKSVFVYF